LEQIDFKYFKLVDLPTLKTWDYYSLSNKKVLQSNYELVKLKEVIKQRKGSINVEDDKEYKRCRVEWYGKGVVLRDIVPGSSIKTKRQQLCKTDDFLVAEIDAKSGGYGIVPKSLENSIVSSHYFLFEIDQTKLYPPFLGLVIKLKQFSDQVKATGSTNYAAIRPHDVLGYQIPLPPLQKQKDIVGVYLSAVDLSMTLLKKSQRIESGLEDLVEKKLGIIKKFFERKSGLSIVNSENLERWDIEFLLGKSQKLESFFPLVKYGKLFKSIKNGIAARNYSETGLRFLKVTDIKNNTISDKDAKYISVYKKDEVLTANTLLITRKGTVGQSYYLKTGNYAASSEIFIIKLNEDIVDGEFFAEVNLCQFIKNQYQERYTGTIMPSLSQDKLKDISLPLPDIKTQKEIVLELKALKSEIKKYNTDSQLILDQAHSELETKLFIS